MRFCVSQTMPRGASGWARRPNDTFAFWPIPKLPSFALNRFVAPCWKGGTIRLRLKICSGPRKWRRIWTCISLGIRWASKSRCVRFTTARVFTSSEQRCAAGRIQRCRIILDREFQMPYRLQCFPKLHVSVGKNMKEKPYQAAVCNICGCAEYRRVHHFKDWPIGSGLVQDVSVVQCRHCKVRRRMPEIIDDYEEEYHQQYTDQGQFIHPHQLYHFADLMTTRLTQFKATNITFLDVGCSMGRALKIATALGFQVTGLDVSR